MIALLRLKKVSLKFPQRPTTIYLFIKTQIIKIIIKYHHVFCFNKPFLNHDVKKNLDKENQINIIMKTTRMVETVCLLVYSELCLVKTQF